jgi:hypothetical protein
MASLNVMRWDRVILNLPGSADYDPALLWVTKWEDVVNQISGNAVNVGGSGHSLEKRVAGLDTVHLLLPVSGDTGRSWEVLTFIPEGCRCLSQSHLPHWSG